MMKCDHDYFLDRYYWQGGRLYEVLKCKKCGHESKAWTDCNSTAVKYGKNETDN